MQIVLCGEKLTPTANATADPASAPTSKTDRNARTAEFLMPHNRHAGTSTGPKRPHESDPTINSELGQIFYLEEHCPDRLVDSPVPPPAARSRTAGTLGVS